MLSILRRERWHHRGLPSHGTELLSERLGPMKVTCLESMCHIDMDGVGPVGWLLIAQCQRKLTFWCSPIGLWVHECPVTLESRTI